MLVRSFGFEFLCRRFGEKRFQCSVVLRCRGEVEGVKAPGCFFSLLLYDFVGYLLFFVSLVHCGVGGTCMCP